MNFRDYVRKVDPYVPGEQPKYGSVVKLNTNENPYPPSPAVQAAIDGVSLDSLKLYPDPDCSELRHDLADHFGVKEDQVFIGVGTDDVLATAFMTFFNSSRPILFPDISYAFYEVWANMLGIPYEKKPLTQDLRINADDYKGENGGIVFPNPNAPTSVLEPVSFIEEILKNNRDSLVIIDEAYIDFGGESAVPLVSRYDNLLVTQTFSKSRSLAGMRIGFAIGCPEIIGYMMSVRNSYNSYTMNRTALAAGAAAIKDTEYFERTRNAVIKTREQAVRTLKALGFDGPEPAGNFLFVTHEAVPAREIFTELKKRGIFVRYFSKPRIDNYLRITVGTEEEMKKLYAALDGILQQKLQERNPET